MKNYNTFSTSDKTNKTERQRNLVSCPQVECGQHLVGCADVIIYQNYIDNLSKTMKFFFLRLTLFSEYGKLCACVR